MNCPACKKSLRERSVGEITVDMCYGGCGGLWFDATELERVSGPAASALHRILQTTRRAEKKDEPRNCPRCTGQVLARKWFSPAKEVEIDQCQKCGGIWLDDGEFSRVYEETRKNKADAPRWAVAIAEAANLVKTDTGAADTPPHA